MEPQIDHAAILTACIQERFAQYGPEKAPAIFAEQLRDAILRAAAMSPAELKKLDEEFRAEMAAEKKSGPPVAVSEGSSPASDQADPPADSPLQDTEGAAVPAAGGSDGARKSPAAERRKRRERARALRAEARAQRAPAGSQLEGDDSAGQDCGWTTAQSGGRSERRKKARAAAAKKGSVPSAAEQTKQQDAAPHAQSVPPASLVEQQADGAPAGATGDHDDGALQGTGESASASAVRRASPAQEPRSESLGPAPAALPAPAAPPAPGAPPAAQEKQAGALSADNDHAPAQDGGEPLEEDFSEGEQGADPHHASSTAAASSPEWSPTAPAAPAHISPHGTPDGDRRQRCGPRGHRGRGAGDVGVEHHGGAQGPLLTGAAGECVTSAQAVVVPVPGPLGYSETRAGWAPCPQGHRAPGRNRLARRDRRGADPGHPAPARERSMTPPRSAAIARAAPESVLAPRWTGQPPQPRPHPRPAETRQVRARRGARRSSQAAPPPRRASPPPTPVLSDGDADGWAEGRMEVAAGSHYSHSAGRSASRRARRAAPSQRRPPVPELSAAAEAWSSQQRPPMLERSAPRAGTSADCTAPHLPPAPVPPPRLDGSPGDDMLCLPVAMPVFPPPPFTAAPAVCNPLPLPASGATAVLADRTPGYSATDRVLYAVPLTPAAEHYHLPRANPAPPLGGTLHPGEPFTPPLQFFPLQDGFSSGWASAPLIPLQCAAASPSAPPPEVMQLAPQPLPEQPAQLPQYEQPLPAAPGQSETELCVQQQGYAPCGNAPTSAPDNAPAARHPAASGDPDGEQEDGLEEGFIAYL